VIVLTALRALRSWSVQIYAVLLEREQLLTDAAQEAIKMGAEHLADAVGAGVVGTASKGTDLVLAL
jgi:hypothetical protein